MNYHVADFIIRVKNAYKARRKTVVMPYSQINKSIGQVLTKAQFLSGVTEEEQDGKKVIVASLRYVNRRPVVHDVLVISKPSLRVYTSVKHLVDDPQRRAQTAILSTPQGIMTGKEAAQKGVGGELLFKIW